MKLRKIFFISTVRGSLDLQANLPKKQPIFYRSVLTTEMNILFSVFIVVGIYNFVYRHDSVDAQNPLCPLMFEPDQPGSAYDKYLSQVGPIYSNLDALEFLRNPNDNSIHFKLAYPRTTNYDQFIWKQTSNPVSQANVEGFEMQQESPAYVL